MKGEKGRFAFVMMLTLMLVPTTASANIVWPTIYIAEGLRTWYVILAGLIIEFLAIKYFIKSTWLKSGLMAVIMNAVSTLVGVLLIPFVGFFGAIGLELLDSIIPVFGTFDTAQWIWGYILAVLSNVLVEGLTLKFIFKLKFRKIFLWLTLANAISVIICILLQGLTLPDIMM